MTSGSDPATASTGIAATRSWLFVPGDRAERWLPSADAAAPDVIILDLEDAVAAEAKEAARHAVVAALMSRRTMSPAAEAASRPVFVRINGLHSPWWRDDLAAVAESMARGVVLPKCESPADVAALEADWRTGTDRPLDLLAILESPRGVLAAAEVARGDGVIGLALGAEDLAASLGARRTPAGDEILVARSLVVLAAAAAGRWAIDTPCLELEDLAVVERDARRAADLGFGGKLVIHPDQVGPVHRGFLPDRDEVESARRVVAAADELARAGRGVGRSGGQMIDRPIIAAARTALRRAAAPGGGARGSTAPGGGASGSAPGSAAPAEERADDRA